MIYIEFNPELHKTAFQDGGLFELQTDTSQKGITIAKWTKVISEEIYEDALNNPIFFAVRMD